MEKTILAIAGKPGLFALVSRASNNGIIVESIDEKKKRSAVSPRDRITSLNDVTVYADDETTLINVFLRLREKEGGKPSTILDGNPKEEEIRNYFGEVLPTFDRDRVYTTDIKKMIRWYNILVSAGITDFEEETAEASEETAAE